MRDCGCCLSLKSNISSCGFFARNRVLIVEEENLDFDSITEYAWEIALTHEISSVRLELHFTYLFGECKDIWWQFVVEIGDKIYSSLIHVHQVMAIGKIPRHFKTMTVKVHSCTWLTWLQTPQPYQPTHCRKARALGSPLHPLEPSNLHQSEDRKFLEQSRVQQDRGCPVVPLRDTQVVWEINITKKTKSH